jgi:hypothetical protein
MPQPENQTPAPIQGFNIEEHPRRSRTFHIEFNDEGVYLNIKSQFGMNAKYFLHFEEAEKMGYMLINAVEAQNV